MRPSLCLTIILAYIAFVTTVPPILAKTLLWYMFSLIALFMHFLLTNQGKKKGGKPSARKAAATGGGKKIA